MDNWKRVAALLPGVFDKDSDQKGYNVDYQHFQQPQTPRIHQLGDCWSAGNPMLAYAARTGTRRNLDALRKANWRLVISAAGVLRTEGFSYALDNGAWTYYQQGKTFDDRVFSLALKKYGPQADWTTIPDIVAGGHQSLDFSLSWMARVLDYSPYALLAVQDGLLPRDVVAFLGERVGIFIGGTTAWKLDTMDQWGLLGKQLHCWVHVGRVNTCRRIARCASAGVTSFDGSSTSRFSVTLPRLEHQRCQLAFQFQSNNRQSNARILASIMMPARHLT
mgnify:FL=1